MNSQDSGAKAIVFSQFVNMLDVINFLKYICIF